MADALGRTVRYSRCGRRERQWISRASTLAEVPAGAVLAREGAPAHGFVIVLTGAATVASGGRIRSGLLAGDHFGDIALLHDRPNPATVVAETPMHLAVVDPAAFSGLIERCPSLARAVLDDLADAA